MAKREYDERFSFILPVDMNLRGDNIDRIGNDGDWWSGRPFSNDLGGVNVGGYPEG
jgi:hypothetical protein